MATAAVDVLTEKPRISSIDITRGIVMVIMALDHARDFYHVDAYLFDPTDLQKTTPILFLTRFITHFCAPTFVLLAGTSVRISQQRKSKKELSVFLLTRGLWLIVLELTVIRFSFFFQLYYDVTLFQVIWVIGFCMVLLAAIIHLPFRAIFIMGVVITFGHDLLNAVNIQAGHPLHVVWTFIHQPSLIELFPGISALVVYPFLPWLGIMLLGYCLGEWYRKDFDPARRKRLLFQTGMLAIALFLILRYLNVYGDPAPWSQQRNWVYTSLSFINVSKYPPSLLYTLLTLGPVMMLLSALEKVSTRVLHPFSVVGRVPLFYYILHFYLLHLGAVILYMINTGKSFSQIDFHFSAGFGGTPPGYGYSLFWAYVAWITVVLLLYPVCAWYNRYKSAHKDWWLSYL